MLKKRFRIRCDRRGVSEVVGALLMMGVILAAAIVYLSFAVNQTSMQSSTIADVLKRARENQEQLISLVYYYVDYVNESMEVHMLIYNYGTHDVIVSQSIALTASGYEMIADLAPNLFGRKQLVDAVFTNPLPEQPTEIVFVTQTGAVYAFTLTNSGG